MTSQNYSKSQNFYNLDIDKVFRAVELCGLVPTGEYLQLNSYENRVFDIYLDNDSSPKELKNHLIVKVYRPERWSLESIQEEHDFSWELRRAGVPVVCPIDIETLKPKSTTLFYEGMVFSFFPKARGRMPQELSLDEFRKVGFYLAQLHNVGARKRAHHRPHLTVEEFGVTAIENLEGWVAPEVWPRYQEASWTICDFLNEYLDPDAFIRIHGDCHRGNILQTGLTEEATDPLFFVDFDDFVNGPAVQDFWMLLPGELRECQPEMEALLSGYCEIRHFDKNQLQLIPALRGLRILHYANWIARRWQDPTFPKLFPEFENYVYWAEEVESLEKIAWQLYQNK